MIRCGRRATAMPSGVEPTLWAISDVHVANPDNRAVVDALRPRTPADWMIVAGDVDEERTTVARTLHALADRYEKVVWVPGNHELWTPRVGHDTELRGDARYRWL